MQEGQMKRLLITDYRGGSPTRAGKTAHRMVFASSWADVGEAC